MKKALILVDIQRDFLPGGSLAVAEGNEILPVVNNLLELPFDLIVATQDWHPADHGSFAANHNKSVGEIIDLHGISQILWPVHCVQNALGADFSPLLNTEKIQKIFHKGTNPTIDSYSTFFDNGHKRSTGLDSYLKENGIERVYIAGLATDYCVKYSAIDAHNLGFETYIFVDACRGVNLQPDDSTNAILEMVKQGIKLTSSAEGISQ